LNRRERKRVGRGGRGRGEVEMEMEMEGGGGERGGGRMDKPTENTKKEMNVMERPGLIFSDPTL
jgi:hypothetical protein